MMNINIELNIITIIFCVVAINNLLTVVIYANASEKHLIRSILISGFIVLFQGLFIWCLTFIRLWYIIKSSKGKEIIKMLALITKASEDYWYEFKEINKVEELLNIYHRIIVEKNHYNKEIVSFWDDFKEEDIPLLEKAELHITIYDSWVE